MKKVLSLLLTLAIVAAAVLTLASCGKKKVAAKIGVIRGDASSVEALAWEKYLKDLSDEMGVKIDFTTAIESADQELQAVQNYGSQGDNGVIVMTAYNPTTILEKCQEYKMYMVVGAAHPDFENSDNSLVKDPNVVINDFKNYPYYVGATGPSNYGEVLSGYEMGKSGVAAGFTKYSVFTGATAYGQMMHALRIAGWFAALHDDDPSVTYNGVACTLENWKTITAQLQKDLGVDLSKFKSDKYQILAQAGGYSFLQGDSTAKAAVANLSAAIDELKSRGVWIFGADMDGTDYTALDYSGSIALVIGSEGKGIGRLVREKCDFIASLPMRGKINSLNASVAAGILMFEAAKHRN